MKATLLQWLKAFVQHLKISGYSSRTIECYERDLRQFFLWLEGQELKSLADLTPQLLQRYQIYLMNRPPERTHAKTGQLLSVAGRNRILASLKSFFRYLRKSSKLLSDPTMDLSRAQQPVTLPKNLLSQVEMQRYLGTIDTTTDIGIHDRAVVEVLYGCGLRRSELLGMQLGDVRLAEAMLWVRGKGNRERVVPLGPETLAALRLYLQKVRPLWAQPDCQAVFVSKLHGRTHSCEHMIVRLRAYARQAGIDKPISLHTFRHMCATHLLEGQADLPVIQQLLGHKKLDTTGKYLQVTPQRLRQTLLRCHPREKGWDGSQSV